jgi:hypothetical protein
MGVPAMAEIVNLKAWRKAKAKDEKQRTASANRATFGRTKAEKEAERSRKEREARSLEGHKLEDEEKPV